jgi:hypothetical protein
MGYKWYYGEAPARVLRGYGVGAGGRGHYATHYLENSEEPSRAFPPLPGYLNWGRVREGE